MIKSKLNTDLNVVNKYIDEVKKLYPDSNVNSYNVNDFMSMKEENDNCKNCKGIKFCKNSNIGYKTVYNNEQFSLVECKYKSVLTKQAKERSVIKTLYMPQSVAEAKLSSFDVNSDSRGKIYNYIMNFIANYGEKNGLYLHGTFSKGKTYTLGAIANELGRHNIPCLLIYFPDLVVDLKSAMGTPRFDSLINMLKSVEVLMIDDLGSENMTPWLRDDVLGPIINFRLMDNKPIFISSNLSPAELKKHFELNKGDELKATRIHTRIKDLTIAISMDDSNSYQRSK